MPFDLKSLNANYTHWQSSQENGRGVDVYCIKKNREEIPAPQPVNFLGRIIARFLPTPPPTIREWIDVESTACAINKCMEDNPHLTALFDKDQLTNLLKNHPYLVVNGNALCLSKKLAGVCPPLFQDSYFSQAPIQNPVRCELGHTFEASSIQKWCEIKNNTVCPGEGEPHEVKDPFNIDVALQYAIKTYFTEKRANAEKITKLEGQVSTLTSRLEDAEKSSSHSGLSDCSGW